MTSLKAGLIHIRDSISSKIINKLGKDVSSTKRYLELVQILVERNLKGRYRGSFLGVYWSLLNPLIMTGLYAAIF